MAAAFSLFTIPSSKFSAVSTETFEAFMQRALHDPEAGYYARKIRSIGKGGDFTTAPQLSESPSKAIAAWITQALRETKIRHVIEIGPGLGTLSHQVISHLSPLTRLRTKFHLVESSPALSAQQKSLLGRKVTQHRTIFEALGACLGEAIIFSNELIDAFPVRIFKKTKEDWQELSLEEGKEIFRSVTQLPKSCIFQQELPLGQRIEVHDSYRIWLESWLPLWNRGKMLSIDYGDTSEKLYQRRPKGSVRAYWFHQMLVGDEIYLRPGHQDITADVNFTDITEWSQPWLESAALENFGDFIEKYTSPTDSKFLAAASHFQVLSQTRLHA